ncbi:hypothetical protein PSA5_11050 [Pseudomonas syringae pv. actinidiae]|nr:hypothetical protein PSA5_11050 [Pseudomonas syringae pv. actinidiae]
MMENYRLARSWEEGVVACSWEERLVGNCRLARAWEEGVVDHRSFDCSWGDGVAVHQRAG